MAETASVKAALYLSPKAKFTLTLLKAKLRQKGIKASESSIVENLLMDADENALAKRMR